VGITSRSPRYYVSAAYWDRDSLLWSFPALLDIDPALAREALAYALTTQLRNVGTHSRFIDGTVLEDGFQLDQAAAPLIALGAYVRRTGDVEFLTQHRDALRVLRDRLVGRFDSATGLYSSLQDSQDEFQKLPFITYGNALTWQAFTELAALATRLGDEPALAAEATARAAALRTAILRHCVAVPPGASEPIFASATDGQIHVFTEIPPGSQMKLPLVGFVAEDDPTFVRTYDWLHSPAYSYSFSDQPFGLPGSYRVAFTTSWSVADHLRLRRGREQALKILRASGWDGGIITEGIDPRTGVMDRSGRAFATAAGYVADALWQEFCTKR
jgi:GH15 family glucan-1,4-alpha-glucosidase